METNKEKNLTATTSASAEAAVDIREIAKKNEAAFNGLLNQAFKIKEGTNFIDDFPIWGERFATETIRIGAFSGESLLATAGLRICETYSGIHSIKIGLIGAVATASEARGKGLASTLVAHLVGRAQKLELAAVFLWGSEHHLYHRLGFELCGTQVTSTLDSLKISDNELEFQEGWVDDIEGIVRERRYGISYDRELTRAHRNVRWLSAWKDGKIQAYAALGRGIDLGGMIHEWGGTHEGLQKILSHLKAEKPLYQILGPPDLMKERGFLTESSRGEYLCMGRILIPDHWAMIASSEVQFDPKNPGWDLLYKGENIAHLEDRAIVPVILGPEKFEELEGSKLPVPIWFWGLDSA